MSNTQNQSNPKPDSYYFNPSKPINDTDRYILSEMSIRDLGLEVVTRKSRRDDTQRSNPFMEFDNASPQALRILKHRLSHLNCTQADIEQKKAPIEALFRLFNQYQEGASVIAENFLEVLKSYSLITKNFNRELRSAREKIYPLNKTTIRASRARRGIYVINQGTDGNYYRSHWAPYPVHARPVIQFVKAVTILADISHFLGQSQDSEIIRIKQKIDQKLANPKLKIILENQFLKDNFDQLLNPYLVVTREDFKNMSKKWKELGYKKSYKAAYFGYWKDYQSSYGREDCYMHKQEHFWRRAALSLKGKSKNKISEKSIEHTKQLQTELRKIFDSLSDLHELVDVQGTKKGSPGARVSKCPELTAICSSIQGSLIPKLEYYVRATLMLSNGAKYASQNEGKINRKNDDSTYLDVKGFVNTTIRETVTHKREMDIFSLFLGKSPNVISERISAKPIDLKIPNSSRNLFLTGPNNAGKTVASQAVGTIKVIAQAALPIFAESSKLDFHGKVYTAFSASYQYQEGLGHLALTLKKLREISDQAKAGDLLIIDELPAGTDYRDLLQISYKIYRNLLQRGITIVVSSHLKQTFGQLSEEFGINVQMTDIKFEQGRIVHDYQPRIGIATHSYGIELMGEVGLPVELVEKSRKYYSQITATNYPEYNHRISPRVFQGKQELQKPLLDGAQHLYTSENYQFSVTKLAFAMIIAGIKPPEDCTLNQLFLESNDYKIEDQSIEERNIRANLMIETFKVLTSVSEEMYSNLKFGMQKLGKELKQIVLNPNFIVGADDLVKVNKLVAELSLLIQNTANNKNISDYFKKIQSELDLYQELAPKTMEALATAEDTSLVSQLINQSVKPGQATPELEKLKNNPKSLTYKWQSFLSILAVPLYQLDLLIGSTEAIKKHKLCAPELVDQKNFFEIKNSQPYLPNSNNIYHASGRREASTFIKDAQAISFKVDQSNQISIIFGPNNTGKTTLGFNCVANLNLALNGFFVPADLKVSKNLAVTQFFGADNRSNSGQSLFKHTLEKLGVLIQEAKDGTVIFLDELKGTDFVELAAIQLALIDYCKAHGLLLVYNTHIRDGMHSLIGKENISFFATDYDFDPETLTLTPKYQIKEDSELKTQSHGIAIARKYFPELFD